MRLLLLPLSLAQSALCLGLFSSIPLPLSGLFNNQAASVHGVGGNFTAGASYDATLLPTGNLSYAGVTYLLPNKWGSGADNVLTMGQKITLPQPIRMNELHVLYAGDGSDAQSTYSFNITFSDATTETISVTGKGWWAQHNQNSGPIETPYHFENGSARNNNFTIISQWSNAVNSTDMVTSITLPSLVSGNRMHIFAMAYTPTVPPTTHISSALTVRQVRFTSNWEVVNGQRAQVVEVTLVNLLNQGTPLTANNTLNGAHSVSITGPSVRTVQLGVFYRLAPSDQARVNVMVVHTSNSSNGNSTSTVGIVDSKGNSLGSTGGFAVSPLKQTWSTDPDDLKTHETPLWWNEAKFGIFVHWGVYSVPAWAPPHTYAEWYDWTIRNPPDSSNPTWNHHLSTYGASVVYDDFISNFTASKFNASQWLDLFDNAGAKYFVLVSKHHDGFALFDGKNTTHRNSVAMGPKRDLVGELLSTAQKEKPNMHKGTYYSLPEWFNPDYAKYGITTWPGGLARNAYNQSVLEPYTGHINISDYLEDLQLPHMLSLAKDYGTDIMWCDIGGANLSPQFASQFYNQAWAEGKQVTMNDRCGAPYDFDTPEYTTFGSVQTRSWETNEGMDPFSYGLNSATNASQYMSPDTLVQTLVDIVSHNGNFLLDVGPTAEGEIIQPETDNLLAAGKWIKSAGSCIYSTQYWYRAAKEGDNIRFLTTPKTFCIISLAAPENGQLTVTTTTPLMKGDTIQLLGAPTTAGGLNWTVSNGQLVINVPQSSIDTVEYAWAFEATYAF